MIMSLSAAVGANVNNIELLDKLFVKIETHSTRIHANSILDDEHDLNPEPTTTVSVTDVASLPETKSLRLSSARAYSEHCKSFDFAQLFKRRGTRQHSPNLLSGNPNHVVVDFLSLQKDEELCRLIAFAKQHDIRPGVCKLFRSAITRVLAKYHPKTFDDATRQKFSLLLRTMTSLILGS